MNDGWQSSSPNAFATALQWLQGTLLGTIATTVAVIAVASVGFLLLSGRIDVRRGAQVVFGCFILFGASTIAAGIVGAVGRSTGDSQAEVPASSLPLPSSPTVAARAQSATPYDPYAGAAVPPRP